MLSEQPLDAQQKLVAFFDQFPAQSYQKGRKLVRAGQKLSHIYYLTEGSIKMSATSEDGQNLTLHVFQPGSFFSLIDLFTQAPNRYDFEVLQDVTVKVVPKSEMLHFLQSEPDVTFATLSRMVQGLARMTNRVEQSVFGLAQNQVSSLLLYFARHYGEKTENKQVLKLRITHQDIAEWLGLSRENVSLQMKKLERSGFISREKNQIVISDVGELEKLANQNLSFF